MKFNPSPGITAVAAAIPFMELCDACANKDRYLDRCATAKPSLMNSQSKAITMRLKILTLSTLALLAGCAQPGADLAANVYQGDQVNQVQNAKVIDILSLSPARVEVSNAQNQKTAEVAGGLLGALAGGVTGNQLGHATGAGLLVGGVAGAAAGSLVPASTLVDGVTIGYTEAGNTLTSTQVGEMCQFQMGKALVVSTQQNETRVQPNATCPPPKNG
jgi:outer membrane lipoprotein SlyB